MPLFRPYLDELGLTENRGAKKKASASPKTWAMPKSWEKPRLHLFSFKDLQDPSLERIFPQVTSLNHVEVSCTQAALPT